MSVSDSTKPEVPAAFYDEIYAAGGYSYKNPQSNPYYPMFVGAVDALKQCAARDVLEVGCGNGTLAQMVMAEGIGYRGFDYARAGVETAQRRNPGANFFWGDATTDAPYAGQYDTILCCEVLEHIQDDLGVIARWRPGCSVVCSVPNFDHASHVRLFHNEDEVRARYEPLLAIGNIRRIPKSQRSGLTAGEYFRRVRWAREDGWRKVLGTLGVNSFDWSGGWFLFTGIRR